MTSILPTDDSFDEGATPYGSSLCGYMAGGFWTNQNVFTPHPAQTIGFQPLHDGYKEANIRRAAFAGSNIGQLQAGVLYRDLYTANDIAVRMTQHALQVSGAVSDPNLAVRMQMVGARISGGSASAGSTPVSALNPQRITDVDLGYFFGYISDASRATWFLLKVGAGGVVTVLDSQPFTGTTLDSEIDPFMAHTLTLDVSDSGADVDLNCTVKVAEASLPLPLKVVSPPSARTLYNESGGGGGTATETVFAYTDPSASSPIQTAGRIGFISTGSHTAAGGQIAVIVDEFSYNESAGATWPLVDRFDFFDRRQSFQYKSTETGFEGISSDARDMRSGWGGDYFGVSGSSGELVPAPVAAGGPNRIEATDTGSTETTGGFFLSRRAATDDRSTHRRIQMRFDTTGTGPSGPDFRQIGIGARCGRISTEPWGGYEIDARPDENSLTGALFLRRWASDGTSATTIAEKTGLTITPGTDYTLALRLYNLPDASGNQDGIVVIEAYIDGTQVVLEEPSTAISGVSVLSSGTVYDNSTERTISGSGEWLRLAASSGVTRSLVVDAWTELSLEGTPGGPEEDEASIAVSTEVTGHLAGTSFDNRYDWPVEESRTRILTIFPYDSGDVRNQLHDTNSRRVWRFSAGATTAAERTSLRTLWDSARGVELSFEYTPPGESSAVKVHFVNPELGMALLSPGVHSFQLELEEVFG